MTAHPSVEALRDGLSLWVDGDPAQFEAQQLLRAALTAAVEETYKECQEATSGQWWLDTAATVARLLGEPKPAPFTHDEIRAWLEGNAAGEGKSLDDYLEEK